MGTGVGKGLGTGEIGERLVRERIGTGEFGERLVREEIGTGEMERDGYEVEGGTGIEGEKQRGGSRNWAGGEVGDGSNHWHARGIGWHR